MRVNKDKGAALYKAGQATEHFIPYLDFAPKWFIDCGPGSAVEFLNMRYEWPTVKLIGLEPSPVGYEAAKARWPKDGVLLNAAVWDCDGTVKLCYPQDLLHGTCYHDGQHNIADDTTLPADFMDVADVPCRSIDSLDIEYGPFVDAALWMDIEGAERRALKGAAKVLERGGIRAVNLETRPDVCAEVAAVLQGYGFRKVREYFACETVRDEVWLKG
jgi:FkbM family methyltransferase